MVPKDLRETWLEGIEVCRYQGFLSGIHSGGSTITAGKSRYENSLGRHHSKIETSAPEK